LALGFDTDQDCTSVAKEIRAKGYKWVGRYINPSKVAPLTNAESKSLSAAGLYIVSIFEANPTGAFYFTASRGITDAREALAAAKSIGQPAGSEIYFTVDYDAAVQDITGAIDGYFSALLSEFRAMKSQYRVGVYGSNTVTDWLKGHHPDIDKTWTAQSTGWGGYSKDGHSILQGASFELVGRDCDVDQTAPSGGGGWKI